MLIPYSFDSASFESTTESPPIKFCKLEIDESTIRYSRIGKLVFFKVLKEDFSAFHSLPIIQ